MKRTIRSRIEYRIRNTTERVLVRLFGRPLYCTACGRQLFRAIPIVWRGRVRLIGSSESNVRVAFGPTKTQLELRHVELDQCPAPDRPWVR